jgi:hypothetical protein
LLSLLNLEDLLGLLMSAQSGSEGSGELGSQELSSLAWVGVEVSSQSRSLLLIQDGQVSGDVFSDCFNFSQLSSATWWGLGISKIS